MASIKRIGLLTSGGDSSGMNPCIRAVVRTALYNGIEVMGIRRGYQGLIDDDVYRMDASSVGGIINKGGTILYTSRCKAFREDEGKKQAHETLTKHDIDALVVIGGDGSYRGAKAFSDMFDFPVITAPGTIDNDIAGTDYTLGYDTAVNVAMDAIDKIRDTATSHGRLFLVEVMGRHAGYIALEVGIASGAEDILIPETKTDFDDIIAKIEKGRERGKRSSILVVAEGDEAGGAFDIAKSLEGKTDYPMRVTILGHLQRGGTPTAHERLMGSRFGYYAIEGLLQGHYGNAVGCMYGKPTYTPLSEAIRQTRPIEKVDLELVKALAI